VNATMTTTIAFHPG